MNINWPQNMLGRMTFHFPLILTCACGESWEFTPPKKLRTQETFDYVLAEWRKKHGEHLNTVTEAKTHAP